MKPRLAAVTGPRQGATIPLDAPRLTVGRDQGSDLSLASMWVSRQHCVFERQGGGLRVTDLGSHNGTFVNGVPVKERELRHGDQVRVGDSVFTVLLHEAEASAVGTPVELHEREIVAGATFELPPSAALAAAPPTGGKKAAPVADVPAPSGPPAPSGAPAPAAGADGRAARDLSVLLRISAAVNSIRGVRALERRLLESIFEVVPAERGALLVAGRVPGEIDDTFGMDRQGVPGRAVRVSRTIAQRVLKERVSILSNDVRDGADFGPSASLLGANVHSVLAVPLSFGERVLGALYLDSSKPEARFDRTHLELLTAIAGIATVALENARQIEWLESENRRLVEDTDLQHSMVGESAAMASVLSFVSRVAQTDSTVLLTGESGTGKELVARAIHQNSPRAGRPFVAINCAALAESLLESELFGHERGAFTGAVVQKKGKLEAADSGTVFLDEIGELAPHLQAKLLRVLQEHAFERVGGTRPIRVDVRVVAATNRDLKEMSKTGGFREDLYYRINVVSLPLPPLRDRREDIPLLARYFTSRYAERCNRRVEGISSGALEALVAYDWPGNIRELENAVERAVVLGSGEMIRPEDLPEGVIEAEPRPKSGGSRYQEAILETKKRLILEAFRESGGNYVETARLLDVHPNYLHRLIRNMNLKGLLKK